MSLYTAVAWMLLLLFITVVTLVMWHNRHAIRGLYQQVDRTVEKSLIMCAITALLSGLLYALIGAVLRVIHDITTTPIYQTGPIDRILRDVILVMTGFSMGYIFLQEDNYRDRANKHNRHDK